MPRSTRKGPPSAGASAGNGRSGQAPYHQPSLLDSTDSEEQVLYDQYRQFVDENPRLLDCMIRLARDWKTRRGAVRIGINCLIETARYHVMISTTDPEYKINNNFGPYFSRDIASRCPDLAPLFHFRASRADRHFNMVFVPGGGPRLDRGPGAS